MDHSKKNAGSRLSSFACFLGSLLVLCVLSVLIYIFLFGSEEQRANADIMTDYVVDQIDIFDTQDFPAPGACLTESAAGMVDTAQYLVFPKRNVGKQTVAILVHLADGTTRTENVTLSIHKSALTWEIGTAATPETLLGKEFADAEFVQPLSGFTELGTFELDVKIGEKVLPFSLTVQDTTPPKVEVQSPAQFTLNQVVKVEDVLVSYEDISKVEFHIAKMPDTHENCTGTLQLVAVDAAGNSATFDVDYEVNGDCTPPVISGVKDMKTIRYVNIATLHGITASDETDGEVPVEIQLPSNFNIKTAGDYPVTYTAKDSAGNIAKATATIHILKNDDIDSLTEEDVLRMGYYINDTLLAVKEGEEPLTEKEKARRIYFQVQNHIKFKDNTDDLPWHINAALVLQRGYGDCRNYCGYAKMLYTCAGFENMVVEHIPASPTAAKHFWNLVKINGEWWHCDSTPRIKAQIFFMWTDAQMDAYSKTDGNCFERDRSLYPKTPD